MATETAVEMDLSGSGQGLVEWYSEYCNEPSG
jgi:hypothetical protein